MAVAETEPYLPLGDFEDLAAWASTVLLVKVVSKDGRVGWGET
jgi:L-alanine-DL-glutamate epimerase-like enolase superfamily enzyme